MRITEGDDSDTIRAMVRDSLLAAKILDRQCRYRVPIRPDLSDTGGTFPLVAVISGIAAIAGKQCPAIRDIRLKTMSPPQIVH
jgi:hypothetical protein